MSDASSVMREASSEGANRVRESLAPYLVRITTSHDDRFAQLLEGLNASLLISMYQAWKVAVVRARGGELHATYHKFQRPMGIAVSPEQVAIGTNDQIWFFPAAHHIAGSLRIGGPYDTCHLARGSHFTGEIHGHEMEEIFDVRLVPSRRFPFLSGPDARKGRRRSG